nr:endothelin-converting enzyme 1-like [Dermacentor andersoni]
MSKQPGKSVHGSQGKQRTPEKQQTPEGVAKSSSTTSPHSATSPIGSATISPAAETTPKPVGTDGKGDKPARQHGKAGADKTTKTLMATQGTRNQGKSLPGDKVRSATLQDQGKYRGKAALPPPAPPSANKVVNAPAQAVATSPTPARPSIPKRSPTTTTSQPKTSEATKVAPPPKQHTLGVKIAILLACSVAIVLVTSAVLYMVLFKQHKRSTILLCQTDDCRKHAALLTENLDTNLDPCEDFAAYVCSAARNLSLGKTLVNSVSQGMQYMWYEHFGEILRSGASKFPVGRKALAMYDTCLNYSQGAPQHKKFLEHLRRSGLDWPGPPATLVSSLAVIVNFGYRWRSPLWIAVSVLQNNSLGSTAARRRVLVRLGMYIPAMLEQHQDAKATFNYIEYWKQYLDHLYPDEATRPALNKTAVDEVRRMEMDVLQNLGSLLSSKDPEPTVLSFRQLPEAVPNVSTEVWLQSFQATLTLEPTLNADDEIVVRDIKLLKVVAKLLSNYTEIELNRHLAWLFVQYYAPVADYRLLVGKYGDEKEAKAHLRDFCARIVEEPFRALVLALSLVSRVAAPDRKIIEDGFNGLISAAVDRINVSIWADSKSKEQIIKKLQGVKKAFWPPGALLKSSTLENIYANFAEKAGSLAEFWINNSVAAFSMNVTQEYEEAMRLRWNNLPGYASYNYVLNTLELAMSAMEAPAYYRNGTRAMLHGGLLFIMANQLIRAMDQKGLRWTTNGFAVNNSLVTNYTLKELQKKESCLAGKGASSPFPELPAFAVSVIAMRKAHERDGGQITFLREDLSEEKVFYMTLCYLSCDSSGQRNPQAPDCNKVVRNSVSFSKAFNCPVNSPMNPKKKCFYFKKNPR